MKPQAFKVGSWVVETDAETLWCGPNGYTFRSKADAVRALAREKLDIHAMEHTEQIDAGCFVYSTDGMGVGAFGECFYIWRLTENNIEDFKGRDKEPPKSPTTS